MIENVHGVKTAEGDDYQTMWVQTVCPLCAAIVHTVNLAVHMKWHEDLLL